MYFDGIYYVLNGNVAANGLLRITGGVPARIMGKRVLGSWNELSGKLYPQKRPYLIDSFILKSQMIISTPAIYPGEELTVSFYRDAVSTPQLDGLMFMPTLKTTMETISGNDKQVSSEQTPLLGKLEYSSKVTAENNTKNFIQDIYHPPRYRRC